MTEKATWLGQDIAELPREKLIEIIHHLGKELDQQRRSMQSVIDIEQLARKRLMSGLMSPNDAREECQHAGS